MRTACRDLEMPVGRGIAVLLICAVLGISCSKGTEGTTSTEASTSVTYSSVAEVISISPESLSERIGQSRGVYVVVNFWATWCPPCLNEMPELAAFYRAVSNDGVRFFSVAVMSDPETAVRPFMERNDVPFPVYHLDIASPDDLLEAVRWDTRWDGALPATFVIAPDGSVAKEFFEEVAVQDLLEAVKRG